MATVDGNAFEIERRGFQWSMNNTLDDGQSSLLYDGNPNNIVSGNTAGETKLYSLLPGGTYFQSTGEWWIKTSSPNTWSMLVTDSSLQSELTATDTVTYSQLTSLSAELIDEIATATATSTALTALSSQLHDLYASIDSNYIQARLSDHCSRPATNIACFPISAAHTSKVLISATTPYDYFSAEMLIRYYNIQSTSNANVTSAGVTYNLYGILGDVSIVELDVVLNNNNVTLTIQPVKNDTVVELTQTLITPLPRNGVLSPVQTIPSPPAIPNHPCDP